MRTKSKLWNILLQPADRTSSWLSSGPPELFTFSYCAWLWNWVTEREGELMTFPWIASIGSTLSGSWYTHEQGSNTCWIYCSISKCWQDSVRKNSGPSSCQPYPALSNLFISVWRHDNTSSCLHFLRVPDVLQCYLWFSWRLFRGSHCYPHWWYSRKKEHGSSLRSHVLHHRNSYGVGASSSW